MKCSQQWAEHGWCASWRQELDCRDKDRACASQRLPLWGSASKGSNLEPLGSVAISTSKPLVNKADPEKHWLRKPQKPHETETQAYEFLKKNIPQESTYISTVWRESWFGISTLNQVASSVVISVWVLSKIGSKHHSHQEAICSDRLGGRLSLSLLASPQFMEQK